MIKANFNAYGKYIADSLYQWDLNRVLSVTGLNLTVVPEVHFSNNAMRGAIVRQATMENHVVSVKIPNSLLQYPLTIKAHIGIYEGDEFKVVEEVQIPVIAKKRPEDYQIEDSDEEIYSFKRLENEIANLATKNQVANIVAVASETGDNIELIDVRYGIDGKTYSSAGEAVREQMSKLYDKINMVDSWIAGSFVRYIDGAIVENAEYSYTDFIALRGNNQYLPVSYSLSLGGYGGIALYDEDKKYLYGIGASQTLTLETVRGIITDSAVYYARFTCYTKNIPDSRVELASAIELVKEQDAIRPCDYSGEDITVFTKGICVGDSLTEGTMNYTVNGDDGNYVTYDKYSYPRNLERITGIEIVNMGLGGVSSAEWYAAKANADLSGYDFAIVQLGVNDVYRYNGWTTTSANGFTSIISKLRNENKNIKIFVSTIIPARSYTGASFDAVSDGIRNLVAGFNDDNIILLDMARYGHTGDSEAYNCGHLSAYGYNRLARDYKAYISWYINNNKRNFREVQFIGTDYVYAEN